MKKKQEQQLATPITAKKEINRLDRQPIVKNKQGLPVTIAIQTGPGGRKGSTNQ